MSRGSQPRRTFLSSGCCTGLVALLRSDHDSLGIGTLGHFLNKLDSEVRIPICRRSALHACLEDAIEIFTECCVCVAGPYS